MIRLVKVELARLAARKVVLLTVLAALGIGLVTVFGVYQQAAQIDRARAGADQALQDIVEGHDEMVEQCRTEERLERERAGDDSIDFGCDQMRIPTIEEMYGQMPSLHDQYEMLLGVLPYPLMFLALALGATGVAAEFAHRTMGSWLTFEPRRTLVYLSKIVASAIAAVPIGLVGLVTVLVGVPLVFRWFRIDDGVTPAEWSDLTWMSLRILLLVVVAGVMGAAAGFLLRHSGLVIGLLVGYLVLVEGMLAQFFTFLSPLTLGRNITAVIHDGTQWTSWPVNCGGMGMPECRETVHSISLTHGVVVLAVVVAAVAALAWLRFVRDDVD